MTNLSNFKLEFEDVPPNTRKGRKDHQMSKATAPAEYKSAKRYTKTRGEHYKDIVIAVLVTAVAAFIVGAHYANAQHAATDRAVQAATVQTDATKK